MKKRKKRIMESLMGSTILLMLTRENMHLLFTSKMRVERRSSANATTGRISGLESDEEYVKISSPCRSKSKEPKQDDAHTQSNGMHSEIEVIGEDTFIIQSAIDVPERYSTFLTKVWDNYRDLMSQIEIVETVCNHLLKLSNLCQHSKTCNVHKTMFLQYVIQDPLIKASIKKELIIGRKYCRVQGVLLKSQD